MLAIIPLLLVGGCKSGIRMQEQHPVQVQNYKTMAYQGPMDPDDGQWIRPAKDLASLRYSSLEQINTSNVGTLRVAFTFSLGTEHGAEAAPIVVNNTMYLVTPW